MAQNADADETETETDAEPIRIRWQGDARQKFKGRKVQARKDDGNTEGERAYDTLDRAKTRVVVRTQAEARALENMLYTMTRTEYSWTTGHHKNAFKRVLSNLRDGMAERGWNDETDASDETSDADTDADETTETPDEPETSAGVRARRRGNLKSRKHLPKGRVVEYRNSYYWVPNPLEDEHLHPGDQLETREITSTDAEPVKFNSQDQAQVWGRLMEIGPSYEDNPIDDPRPLEIARHRAEDARIPVPVALEGKAKIAAYLYAVGYSKLSVSHALDVSERTIGQYISDVKRGVR